MHAIDTMKGLTVMLGDSGTGKTAARVEGQRTAVRRTDKYVAALMVIVHSEITPDWFLRKIATQFDIEKPGDDKKTLITSSIERLQQIHDQGKKAFVLVTRPICSRTRRYSRDAGIGSFRGARQEAPFDRVDGLPDLEKEHGG